MKYLISFFLLLSISFTQSIWEEGDSSPYGPKLASAIGDMVMIRIEEYNTAMQKAETAMRKNSRLEGTGSLSWSETASYLKANRSMKSETTPGLSTQKNFSGRGSTGRSSKLQSQLTAVVYRVEGTRLFIHGSKRIIINNEEEELTIEGVIRKEDILADNSVISSKISDAVLKIKGYGNVSNDQEKGFLTKMVDWLF